MFTELEKEILENALDTVSENYYELSKDNLCPDRDKYNLRYNIISQLKSKVFSQSTCKTCKQFGAQGVLGLQQENGENRYCAAYLFGDIFNENFIDMPEFKITFGNNNEIKGKFIVNEKFGCINHNDKFDEEKKDFITTCK